MVQNLEVLDWGLDGVGQVTGQMQEVCLFQVPCSLQFLQEDLRLVFYPSETEGWGHSEQRTHHMTQSHHRSWTSDHPLEPRPASDSSPLQIWSELLDQV